MGPAIRLQTAVRRSYAVPAPPTAALADATAGAGPDAAEFAGAERRSAFNRERRGGSLARLMESTEFVQALGQQRHAMLDARFAALFRMLNLSGEELARFKGLLVEKENVVLDVVTISETTPGGRLSPESLRLGIGAAQTQVDLAIQSSLGHERYGVYREYERTLAPRATVAQLDASAILARR